MIEALIFVVFPFCMLFAAISDMLSMTIANRVPVLLVAVFALVAPLTGMDWATYGLHFASGGLVLAVTFGLFALGGMGGGDAKLLAATALWMGLSIHLVEYLVASAFIGGLLTL
ncbi:MAG: peptidase, partial [Mesorhizobium sp.]